MILKGIMLNERKVSKGHILQDSIYGILLKRENFIDEDISICQALKLERTCISSIKGDKSVLCLYSGRGYPNLCYLSKFTELYTK